MRLNCVGLIYFGSRSLIILLGSFVCLTFLVHEFEIVARLSNQNAQVNQYVEQVDRDECVAYFIGKLCIVYHIAKSPKEVRKQQKGAIVEQFSPICCLAVIGTII